MQGPVVARAGWVGVVFPSPLAGVNLMSETGFSCLFARGFPHICSLFCDRSERNVDQVCPVPFFGRNVIRIGLVNPSLLQLVVAEVFVSTSTVR